MGEGKGRGKREMRGGGGEGEEQREEGVGRKKEIGLSRGSCHQTLSPLYIPP